MTINPNKKTKNNRDKRIFLRWFRANTGAPDGRFWCLWCYPCAKITDFSKSHFSVLKLYILNSPGIRLEIASRLIQWRLKTWMSVIYFAGLCLSRVSLWSSNDHFETANHRSARKYICGRGIMNFRFNRGRDLREVGPVVEGDQDSPTRLTQSLSSRRSRFTLRLSDWALLWYLEKLVRPRFDNGLESFLVNFLLFCELSRSKSRPGLVRYTLGATKMHGPLPRVHEKSLKSRAPFWNFEQHASWFSGKTHRE